jgi:KilA-N domain
LSCPLLKFEKWPGLLSLTDLYKVAVERGMAGGKVEPKNWSRRDGQGFIEHIAKESKVTKCHVYQTKRGAGGGTFAHPQIALAYAKCADLKTCADVT